MAALHARNDRDAIERVARYKQLCCPEEVRITAKGDERIIERAWLYPGGDEPPFLTDLYAPPSLSCAAAARREHG